MAFSVCRILFLGAPCEIARARVLFVAIQVADVMSLGRTWRKERAGD